ncbi:DNA recombination protein RmuC [Planctomycetales bacterium ZRK34]|nr:DNA recombination protein RmuC [Planctomycetales bacterium ZRK34]
MAEYLLPALLVVNVVVVVLLVAILRRRDTAKDLSASIAGMSQAFERLERSLRDDVAAARKDADESGRLQREEFSKAMEAFRSAMMDTLSKLSDAQKGRLEEFGKRLTDNSDAGIRKLDEMKTAVDTRLKTSHEETTKSLDQMRTESNASAKATRDESAKSLREFSEQLVKRVNDGFKEQNDRQDGFSRRLGELIEASEKRGEALKTSVEQRLDKLREENAQKLTEMQKVVDEKLQGTLEKRLGESFKQVSDRLEQVHKGLGEMQTLANGVGDLKRVMTNVKSRGTWGEFQLSAILEQVLSPDQYEANVATKPGGNERVEFAIRLPGKDEADGTVVYLPIDAKFPSEDYQRLIDAQDAADPDAVVAASKQLENAIKSCAKDISTKYLSPPHTTDFGIMFLPTEGLYAEVVRRAGLVEHCQRHCRVVVAGPTTLAAILNSLQMGFRTLAIQKRSSEVWKVLGAVKTEFGKFGDVIGKVKKKLQEAANQVDQAETRTRVMNRQLRTVEQLPTDQAVAVLGLSGNGDEADADSAGMEANDSDGD